MILQRALMLLVFAASPALAEGGPTAAEREAFIAAVTANGCHMSNEEAEKIMPATGLSRENVRAIADALLADGLGFVTEGETMYVLKTEGCSS